MSRLLPFATIALLVAPVGCDQIRLGSAPAANNEAPAGPAPAQPVRTAGAGGDDPHALHDCATAHPPIARPTAPGVIALSVEARRRVDRLRISNQRESVILRKSARGWEAGGRGGCRVSPGRIDAALLVLQALEGAPTAQRPENAAFELSIVAEAGGAPIFHMDVAGEIDRGRLVQLGDLSAHVIRGLDLAVLSARVGDWCPLPAP